MAETEVAKYGYDVAGAVADLYIKVEDYGAGEIQRMQDEIQGHLDRLDAVRKLKAAIVKALSDGSQSINFNENTELKEAYAAFAALYGEEDADILPENGILPRENGPDVLNILKEFERKPGTFVEYLISIGVVRVVNNMNIMVDCAKEIIKQNADEIRNRLRLIGR